MGTRIQQDGTATGVYQARPDPAGGRLAEFPGQHQHQLGADAWRGWRAPELDRLMDRGTSGAGAREATCKSVRRAVSGMEGAKDASSPCGVLVLVLCPRLQKIKDKVVRDFRAPLS